MFASVSPDYAKAQCAWLRGSAAPLRLSKQCRSCGLKRGCDEREALHRGVRGTDFDALKPDAADAADIALGESKFSPAIADDVPEGMEEGIVDDLRHVPSSLPRILGIFSQRSLVIPRARIAESGALAGALVCVQARPCS